MGVHGLWELLAPVGRRISVEALGNKKLAIDASIWIVQFLKAMRDERGEVLRNAHLLGFFRRICKLLYLRVKPVFVFDGGTPFLKRRTVIARRRQREQAQSKIRKTAEKLLLNHLKARKLEELVREEEQGSLPKQRVEVDGVQNRENRGTRNSENGEDKRINGQALEDTDALFAASLQQNEWEHEGETLIDLQEGSSEGEDHEILPMIQGKVDPAVLGTLPPSMQLRLLDEMKEQLVAENRQKFHKVAKAPASFSELQIESYLKTVAFRREIVQVQKAAANKGIGGVPTTKIASEVDREFIFSSSQQQNNAPSTTDISKLPELSTEQAQNSSSVQTYFDEQGKKRVSRIRGMGVRMTRDLQWNLYLMKDKEKTLEAKQTEPEYDAYLEALAENSPDAETITSLEAERGSHSTAESVGMSTVQQTSGASIGGDDADIEWEEDKTEGTENVTSSSLGNVTGMEIAFDSGPADPDDEIFKSLVLSSRPDEEDEEIEWEEDMNCEKTVPPTSDVVNETEMAPVVEVPDVEWHEPIKGHASEEQEQLEEAIRRSIIDYGPQRSLKIQELMPPAQDDYRNITVGKKTEEDRARKGKALLEVENTERQPSIANLPSQEVLKRPEAHDRGCNEAGDYSLGQSSTSIDNLKEQKGDEDNRHNVTGEETVRLQSEYISPEEHLREAERRASFRAEIYQERERLLQEESDLRTEQKKNERNAESVTNEMFSECQELLQFFGLPYVVAPMEAEAQCAFMDTAGLVDGVITDDSDVFLFGGRSVYKNIFDGKKYVETYYMKDVESDLGLTQDKLIRMAMLLGSDYTEGISGIGIVNAIEVVNAFPEEDGLTKFKHWIDSPDLMLFEKFHSKSRKTSHAKAADDSQEQDISEAEGDVEDRKRRFMQKHRAVSKNWSVPPSFPSIAVMEAYSSPQIDKSTETFSWGRPDLDCLRKFCYEKFAWTKEKADELLLPVLKEYDRHETQLRLDAFYTFNERFAKIRSRRIQKAVTGITGRKIPEIMDASADVSPVGKKQQRRRKAASVEQRNGPVKKQRSRKTAATNDVNGNSTPTKRQRKAPTAAEPRKSARTRKQVKYAAELPEDENGTDAGTEASTQPAVDLPEDENGTDAGTEASAQPESELVDNSTAEVIREGGSSAYLEGGGFVLDDSAVDDDEPTTTVDAKLPEIHETFSPTTVTSTEEESGETRLLAMPFFRRKRNSIG